MEKKFVPLATKISSEKHLVAIRDSFIAMMPVTMAGSVAVLLNVFVRDLPGEKQFNIPAIPKMFDWLISINGNVWWACIGFFAVVFAFSFGYHLSKAYDVNPVAGGLISFASVLTCTPQTHGEAWGGLTWTYTNANGLFTALILGFIVTKIYIYLTKKNVIIKMPDGVPPAVSKAFASIIPGLVAIFFAGTVGYLSTEFIGKPLNDIVVEFVQAPFMSLAQGLPTVILVVLAVQLFWFFGLHGTNILGPLLEGVYKTALLDNNAAYEAGKAIPNLWTGASFNAYAWMGGAGCTVALIIALL
ncbi:MAG: PTS sugar transporter subunit IIC, partial [Coprobacillaceae bacterium]